MGPPSYMRSIVDQNVIMWHMTACVLLPNSTNFNTIKYSHASSHIMWLNGGKRTFQGSLLPPSSGTFIKFITEYHMLCVTDHNQANKIHYLKYKYLCIEMFRSLWDLTNFYTLYSNWCSINLYATGIAVTSVGS